MDDASRVHELWRFAVNELLARKHDAAYRDWHLAYPLTRSVCDQRHADYSHLRSTHANLPAPRIVSKLPPRASRTAVTGGFPQLGPPAYPELYPAS
jgi:hypothetical protein